MTCSVGDGIKEIEEEQPGLSPQAKHGWRDVNPYRATVLHGKVLKRNSPFQSAPCCSPTITRPLSRPPAVNPPMCRLRATRSTLKTSQLLLLHYIRPAETPKKRHPFTPSPAAPGGPYGQPRRAKCQPLSPPARDATSPRPPSASREKTRNQSAPPPPPRAPPVFLQTGAECRVAETYVRAGAPPPAPA
jgi:hypothetical protein